MKFPSISFKGKLILVFSLVSLIPIISLISVSYIIIARSLDRWEDASNELKKLRVLPIVDLVQGVASDADLILALKSGTDLSKVEVPLLEGYIVAIYDLRGNLLFSSSEDPTVNSKLRFLEDIGFPPASEMPKGSVVMPKDSLELNDKEIMFGATICRSEDAKELAIVVAGRLFHSVPINIKSVRRTAIFVLGFTSVLVFSIALWVSSFIAKEITEPIRKLVKGTNEVASGNLDYTVNIQTSDEFAELSRSFNQMTMKLRDYARDLKLAEKSAAWKEVAQKLAHEIKNPLTPIKLSAERLKKRYYSNPDGYEKVLEECVSLITDEVERLSKLLDEFSQFARMPIINPVQTDINCLVQDSLKLCGEPPESISITTQLDPSLPSIHVDPDQMKRAFFNIIKNAIEAMIDRGGELKITTSKTTTHLRESQRDHIIIEFSDNGPGIPQEILQNIFVPHLSTKKGGSGLGLAIVKKIVSDHNGDIIVESRENIGTTFRITLPIGELQSDTSVKA